MGHREGYRRERLDRGIKARADTIFALVSIREILYVAMPRAVPIIALLLLPAVLGFSGEIYWLKVMTVTCMISVMALSWELMNAVGLVSLGQALFFGVGGYISGALNYYLGISPVWSIPAATIGGAIICTALLAPALRVKGIYFSMITLILPMMLSRIVEATKICRGAEGLDCLSPFPSFWVEIYLIVIVLLVSLFVLRRLIDTDYGLVLRGVKDDDRGILALGIDPYKYKMQAVFFAGLLGAFAGAFMAHTYMVVGISSFALDLSVLSAASALLGGAGTFAGPVLGAFILVPISEILRALGSLRIVLYSLVMVGCIVALPQGFFPYIRKKYYQFERWTAIEEEMP
jgi:branched-chain amino acid transport system permease protein